MSSCMYVCMYVCTLYTKAHTHAQVEVSIFFVNLFDNLNFSSMPKQTNGGEKQ